LLLLLLVLLLLVLLPPGETAFVSEAKAMNIQSDSVTQA